MSAVDLVAIRKALEEHGLILRGGFAFGEADEPPLATSGPARAALLVGQGGAAPWPHFRRWLAAQEPGLADPLDTWSRMVIGSVAARFDARAVSPSDKPYLPFQQWAMRAEGLKPSPLGILMHPEYGLWHAYRGALLFNAELPMQTAPAAIHLCDACIGKPCMKACPVEAHGEHGFAYAECLSHVRGNGARCREGGCLDRNACPNGIDYRYPAEVQAFHMKAFSMSRSD